MGTNGEKADVARPWRTFGSFAHEIRQCAHSRMKKEKNGPHTESAESAEFPRAVPSGFRADGRELHACRDAGEARSLELPGTGERWNAAGAHPRFFPGQQSQLASLFLQGCGRRILGRSRLRRGGPLPRRLRRSFLAARGDPSPKLRGRGISGYFCFPGKTRFIANWSGNCASRSPGAR